MKRRFTVPMLIPNLVFMLMPAASTFLFSCNTLDDQLQSQAKLTGSAQLQAANEDNARIARNMEDDLATRQRFYQGVAGVYVGTFKGEAGQEPPSDTIRIELSPSVYPFQGNRQRRMEEVTVDLTNLHLDAIVKLWPAAHSEDQPIGHTYLNVTPDLNSGQIRLIADYPHTFKLWLSGGSSVTTGMANAVVTNSSAGLARSLLQGGTFESPALFVEWDSTLFVPSYRTELRRVRK